jgi:hypothetical protein
MRQQGFAEAVADSNIGLKGRDVLAQGNALGLGERKNRSPEGAGYECDDTTIIPPFQG